MTARRAKTRQTRILFGDDDWGRGYTSGELICMNISRRRGAIAFFITLGVMLTGLTITLNIAYILHNKERVAYVVVGIILFSVLVAGVVLNTVFLIREIRRNERQDSFLNAVTHELKTPVASIRLYLETLQRRDIPEEQRRDFYRIMHADSDRLLATIEQVLKAGELGTRQRRQMRGLVELEPLVAECVSITRQRHHLGDDAIVLEPTPGAVRLHVHGIAEDLRTVMLNLLENAVEVLAGRGEGDGFAGDYAVHVGFAAGDGHGGWAAGEPVEADFCAVLPGARAGDAQDQGNGAWAVPGADDCAAAWRAGGGGERGSGAGNDDHGAAAAGEPERGSGGDFVYRR